MKLYIFQLILFIFLVGCATIPKETGLSHIWPDLQPYSDKFEKSEKELTDIISIENNRILLMDFVDKKLESPFLSWKDQFRLAWIIKLLLESSIDNECSRLCTLINDGKRFKTYFAFINLYIPVDPNYFMCKIDILKEPSYIAPTFNPDGGDKVKKDIVPYVVKDVERATGLSFGPDYIKWKNWWLETGRYLKFDHKERKYK